MRETTDTVETIKKVSANTDGKPESAVDKAFSVKGAPAKKPASEAIPTVSAADVSGAVVSKGAGFAVGAGKAVAGFLKGSVRAVTKAAKGVGHGYLSLSERVGNALGIKRGTAAAGVSFLVLALAGTLGTVGYSAYRQNRIRQTDYMSTKTDTEKVNLWHTALMEHALFGYVEYDGPDDVEGTPMWGYEKLSSGPGRYMEIERSDTPKKWDVDLGLTYFHGAWYYCKMKDGGVYDGADDRGSVRVSAGQEGIVIRAASTNTDYNNGKKNGTDEHAGDNIILFENGRAAYVPYKKFYTLKQIFNSQYKYTDEQILEWVNRMEIPTEGRYRDPDGRLPGGGYGLVFVSMYNQRIWFLKGDNHHWEIVQEYKGRQISGVKCSTGQLHPSDRTSNFTQNTSFTAAFDFDRLGTYAYDPSGIAWGYPALCYTSPGKYGGYFLHPGGNGKPVTHGCVGMPRGSCLAYAFTLPKNTPMVEF